MPCALLEARIRKAGDRAFPPPPRVRDPYSSVALEHLIVARGTTACSFGTVGIDGTVGIERWAGARGDGVSLWAAARTFCFLVAADAVAAVLRTMRAE